VLLQAGANPNIVLHPVAGNSDYTDGATGLATRIGPLGRGAARRHRQKNRHKDVAALIDSYATRAKASAPVTQ
jgi:hypothetical protein